MRWTKSLELADRHGLLVIEDCAQSHGARYRGTSVGTLADVGVYSFCQDKILTTGGEGGMLVTNNTRLWKRAWDFKDHGKCYDTVYHRPHEPGFRWLHKSFGTNWRMTEMQSAIGRQVLRKLNKWVDRRRANADLLARGFSELSLLRTPMPTSNHYHSFYKFYTFLNRGRLQSGWSRQRILESVTAEGVPCFSGSCGEIYLEDAFPREWRPDSRFSVAQDLSESSLMFLVHPTLGEREIRRTIEVVHQIVHAATDQEDSLPRKAG